MNVTVRNVITSMRLISWFDWAEFVESVGLVDAALRNRSAFGDMDFPTRDRYRKAVEELSRGSGMGEVEVATKALDMADARVVGGRRRSVTRSSTPRSGLLPDRRRPLALERELQVRVPFTARLRRAYVRYPASGYLWTVAVLTAAHRRSTGRAFRRARLGGLRRCPRDRPGLRPGDRPREPVVTKVLGPKPLPRLELDGGPPEDMRTLVVVPMLLTSEADLEALVGGLEVHYLGNRDGDVRFALLSDWLDAPTEYVEGDDELLAAAAAAVSTSSTSVTVRRPGEVPASCSSIGSERGTSAEGCWMGWERKRGKLHELNALLRGSTTTGILTSSRPAATPPPAVRYVVTLDADTRLPRGAVGRLVGTIAHPLNHPTFDPKTRPGHPGLRRAAATHHADAAGRARRLDLPADVLRIGRDRPLRLGDLRRVPGPVPRGEFTPAKASTTSMPSTRRWRTGYRRTRS